MPRFMVTRTLPPLTSEQLNAVGKNVIAACDQIGMQWIRSHVTLMESIPFVSLKRPAQRPAASMRILQDCRWMMLSHSAWRLVRISLSEALPHLIGSKRQT